MMINKSNGLRTTKIPACQAFDAVINTVYFRGVPFLLCGDNDRIRFVFTRLGTDDDAFIATYATVLVVKYFFIRIHRCHSLSRMPALSNNSKVYCFCPRACVAQDRQGS